MFKANINPTHATSLLLYPWKHQKTRFFWLFQEAEKDKWHSMNESALFLLVGYNIQCTLLNPNHASVHSY